MGAAAVGATIYFGSQESSRQIQEIAEAFALAHELGMATILWCYLRNSAFNVKDDKDYHVSADLTGQANHLGVTIQADIIKQKLPERNGGYLAMNKNGSYGKTSPLVYEKLTTDNPIDLVRYQVANCFMGRCGLINSGGESKGAGDLAAAVRTAIINKRGGGTGLISGRKAFHARWPKASNSSTRSKTSISRTRSPSLKGEHRTKVLLYFRGCGHWGCCPFFLAGSPKLCRHVSRAPIGSTP